MKPTAYTILGYLAMLLTPVGAVIFFGWRVFTAVHAETDSDWLAVPAGIAAAIGLEMVGIFAGHMAMELWQRKDGRAWLAVAIMAVYVGIGVVELAGTIGQVMFLIAPLVYVLVGLRQAVDEMVGQETAVSAAKLDWKLEQDAKDREAERQRQANNDARQHEANLRKLAAEEERKAREHADETAVKLARIEARAKAAKPTAQKIAENRSPAQIVVGQKFYECECGTVYEKPQSYSAHTRHCETHQRISANGAKLNGVAK